MALVLETGAGLINSNAYADIATADAYFGDSLYAAEWVAATSPNKEKALITGVRLIENGWKFNGSRASNTQAMSWPRIGAPNSELDPILLWTDNPLMGLANYGPGCWSAAAWPSNAIPVNVVRANCEMALLMLQKNRAAEATTKGVQSFSIGNGAVSFNFNASDRPGIFTDVVKNLLLPFGTPSGATSGTRVVSLVR